jgi:imidazole glycerol-phosphate synthase subunit HisH
MAVGIIDFGMGNVASVQKALSALKIEHVLTREFKVLDACSSLILPGVGAFAQGMQNLMECGLDDFIRKAVLENKKPILGICLGMQLFGTIGTEPYECAGLNLIPGRVERIKVPNLRVPHLGWNTLIAQAASIFEPVHLQDFYFIHSYHFKVEKPSQIGGFVEYGEKMVAALQHENIVATQFHPEKSQNQGLMLLESFFNRYAKG